MDSCRGKSSSKFKKYTARGEDKQLAWSAIREINRKRKEAREQLKRKRGSLDESLELSTGDLEFLDVLEDFNLSELFDEETSDPKRPRQDNEPTPGPSSRSHNEPAQVEDQGLQSSPASAAMEIDEQSRSAQQLRQGSNNADSSASGTGSGQSTPFQLWKSVDQIKPNSVVIANTHMFFVWGYAYKWFDVKAPENNNKVVAKRLVTSGAQFMTNELSQFLSKAQFDSLPHNSFVKKLWISLTPVGLEASFQTGSTLSASGSITHVPMLIYNKGANLAIAHEPVKVASEATTPMCISSIGAKGHIKNILWGSEAMNDYPTCLTVPRNWPFYDSFIIPHGKSEDNGNLFATDEVYGVHHLHKLYEVGIASKAVDQNIIFNYEYEPAIGIIKSRKRAHGFAGNGTQYYLGTHGYPGHICNTDNKVLKKIGQQTAKPLSVHLQYLNYDQGIEKSHLVGSLNRPTSVKLMPSFTLGINPVPNNAPADSNSYVNCKMIVKMTTAIEIGFSVETYNTLVETLDQSGELYMKGDSESVTSLYSGISFDSGTGVATSINAGTAASGNIVRDVPKRRRQVDVENVEVEDLNKDTHR